MKKKGSKTATNYKVSYILETLAEPDWLQTKYYYPYSEQKLINSANTYFMPS
ncbi:hypothetical protein ACFOW1_16325 [Parasediminibacterium paludis]|uniref:Uncharacterized protein n=1 Tax=Parasediminibacterium paludis TaxID=908966 RepID=A0ABV8PZI8_9BACT